MSIKSKSYVLDHLKKLKIKKGDNLLIYSDLSRFGLQEANLPKLVLSCFKLAVPLVINICFFDKFLILYFN